MDWTATTPPIPICFIVDRLYRGGTELLLLRLIAGLDRREFSPSLVVLEDESDADAALAREANAPVLRLSVQRIRDPRFLPAALRLAAFLRRNRVAALQLHHPAPTAIGLVAATLAPRARLIRTRFNLGYWLTPNGRRIERLAAGRADVTVANCEAARRVLIEEAQPTSGPIVVIANGIETHRLATLLPAAASDRPRIGLLANLRPIKDPERFVRAAALLAGRWPGATFEIAGEGELRPDLLELASKLNLGSRLRLHGAIADPAAFLATIDVAVLCSRSEGLPNALLEYMAAGRPIVATAVGGIPEAIRDGREGLLVTAGDEQQLADAIARLLGDSALALRLGAAARARCLAAFPLSATIARFSALYRALAASPLPPLRRAGPEARRELARALAGADAGISDASIVPDLERDGGAHSPVKA